MCEGGSSAHCAGIVQCQASEAQGRRAHGVRGAGEQGAGEQGPWAVLTSKKGSLSLAATLSRAPLVGMERARPCTGRNRRGGGTAKLNN